MIESAPPRPQGREAAPSTEEARSTAPPLPQVRVVWQERALWLGPLAFLVSLAGTLLLANDALRGWAVLLLLVAAALAVLAWGYQRWPVPFPVTVGALPTRWPWDRRRLLSIGGVLASGVILLLANLALAAKPGDGFGLAGLLWLASMALLIGFAYLWPEARAKTTAAPADDHLPAASSLPVRRANNTAAAPSLLEAEPAPWARWEMGVFAGIVLLALVLRVWDLSRFPDNVYPDEVMTVQVATDSYMSGHTVPIFSTVWGGIDLPALWFWIVAGSLKLFGSTLAAARLPAALFGAATVAPFYGLVRSVWGRWAAIFGSVVLAVSLSNMHYSRLALNNIVPQFFWVACFFFVIRGLKSRRPSDWAWAGLAGGLSEHFYYGTRLLPFILAAFALFLLVFYWRQARTYFAHLGLLALGYLAGFGPLLAYYLLHPSLYFGRGADMLTWNRIPTSLQDLGQMWTTLSPIVGENLLGISTHPSQDIVFFAPLLLPAEGALLVLGLALLVRHWRHPAAFLVLLSAIGVWFVGGALALYAAPPFIGHWTPAFPAVYAAIAVPAGAWAAPAVIRRWGRYAWAVPVTLALALLVLAVLNIGTYFGSYYADPNILTLDRYRTAQTSYELVTAQSRYLAKLGAGYRIVVVGANTVIYDPQLTSLLGAGEQSRETLQDVQSQIPLPTATCKSAAFLFFAGNEQYRSLIQQTYPGGTTEDITTSQGKHLFFAYRLAPEPAHQSANPAVPPLCR